jgi:hypothetical protein
VVPKLRSGHEESSLQDAEAYVSRLTKRVEEIEQATTTTTTSPKTTTTTRPGGTTTTTRRA